MARSPALALCLSMPLLTTPQELSCSPTLSKRADTSGCGKTHDTGYLSGSSHTIISGGKERTYAINVPTAYNEVLTKQWPLIIDYHGNGETPAAQYNNSRYPFYPAGQDYLVVYPAGYDKHWQGPSYATQGIDDLQFTTELLAHLRTQYCINSVRIYASGKSNGGGFVDTLACSDNGDEFAAFAMASAALYTDTSLSSCSKSRAILESHGDNDTLIPYHPTGPGTGGPLPDVGQWVTWWGQRDRCAAGDEIVTRDLGGYNVSTYSCNGLSNVVTHYQVFDLGHCWPSSTGDNTDGMRKYCKDHALDFTPIVLDWFARWNATNAPQSQKCSNLA